MGNAAQTAAMQPRCSSTNPRRQASPARSNQPSRSSESSTTSRICSSEMWGRSTTWAVVTAPELARPGNPMLQPHRAGDARSATTGVTSPPSTLHAQSPSTVFAVRLWPPAPTCQSPSIDLKDIINAHGHRDDWAYRPVVVIDLCRPTTPVKPWRLTLAATTPRTPSGKIQGSALRNRLSADNDTKHEEAGWRSRSVLRCQRVDRCVWSTARTNWMYE